MESPREPANTVWSGTVLVPGHHNAFFEAFVRANADRSKVKSGQFTSVVIHITSNSGRAMVKAYTSGRVVLPSATTSAHSVSAIETMFRWAEESGLEIPERVAAPDHRVVNRVQGPFMVGRRIDLKRAGREVSSATAQFKKRVFTCLFLTTSAHFEDNADCPGEDDCRCNPAKTLVFANGKLVVAGTSTIAQARKIVELNLVTLRPYLLNKIRVVSSKTNDKHDWMRKRLGLAKAKRSSKKSLIALPPKPSARTKFVTVSIPCTLEPAPILEGSRGIMLSDVSWARRSTLSERISCVAQKLLREGDADSLGKLLKRYRHHIPPRQRFELRTRLKALFPDVAWETAAMYV